MTENVLSWSRNIVPNTGDLVNDLSLIVSYNDGKKVAMVSTGGFE